MTDPALLKAIETLAGNKVITYDEHIRQGTGWELNYNHFVKFVSGDVPRYDPITVFVNQNGITKLEIVCDPCETIEEVKNVLFDRTKIPVIHQHLYFKFEVLKNERTLGSYNITGTSVLHLLQEDVEENDLFFVKDLDGNAIAIDYDPDYTIGEIKNQVADKLERFGDPRSVRLYTTSGILRDSQTLSYYNIQKENIVHCFKVNFNLLTVFINHNGTTNLEIDYDWCQTVEKIKSVIYSQTGIPVVKQNLYFHFKRLKNNRTLANYNITGHRYLHLFDAGTKDVIFVQTLGGNAISIPYDSNNTIEGIKNRIADTIEEFHDARCVQLHFKDRLLKNGYRNTLAYYGIEKECRLQCIYGSFEVITVLVNQNGITIEIVYDSSYTIEIVKKIICDQTSIPVNNQRLRFKFKFLENERTLASYDIKGNSVLHLLQVGKNNVFFVQSTAKDEILLPYNPKATIDSIKNHVSNRLEGFSDPHSVKLYFKNRVLKNGYTLGYYNIESESALFCVNRSCDLITVVVNHNGITNLQIDFDPSDTIEIVKNIICNQTQLPVAKQKLRYMDIILDNGNTLASYKITSRSVLYLSQTDIFFARHFGRLVTMDYSPNCTIESIKNELELQLGCWCVIYTVDGRCLRNHYTLGHYGIQKGSCLHFATRSHGGGGPEYIPLHLFSSEFDFDFTNINDNGFVFKRGDFQYKRPYGWKRFAIKVLEKYENNFWIGASRGKIQSTDAIENEWPVSYHGMGQCNGRSLSEAGYIGCKGKRFKFGSGVYSTPDINVASKYATKYTLDDGDVYMVIFQNRVNPKGLVSVGGNDVNDSEFWISLRECDLRPYGICIKKEICV